MPYMYQADLWCDDCGRKICESLPKPNGFDPDNESTWDSDDYPKFVLNLCSDSPDHCAAGEDCLNKIDVGSRYVGAILTDELTDDGVEYVIEALLRQFHGSALKYSPVVVYWMDEFDLWGEIESYVKRNQEEE